MKKTLSYLLAGLVVLMFGMPVYAGVEITGNVCAGISNVEDENKATKEEIQFDNVGINLDVTAEIADGVTAVGELEGCTKCLDKLEVKAVYIELSKLLPNASLLVGRLDLPIGKEGETMTHNADMMENTMIENSALEGEGVTGSVLDYGIALKTTMGAINCLLGITNGNEGKPTDNNSDKCILLNLSGDVNAIPGLSLAVSYLTNDKSAGNVKCEETRTVVDAAYTLNPITVGVTYAIKEEECGPTKREKDCLGVELSYAVNENSTLAIRQSRVDVSKNEVDDYEMTKLQVGWNYKLADNTLFKLEYVDIERKDKPVAVENEHDKSGIKAAIAVKF